MPDEINRDADEAVRKTLADAMEQFVDGNGRLAEVHSRFAGVHGFKSHLDEITHELSTVHGSADRLDTEADSTHDSSIKTWTDLDDALVAGHDKSARSLGELESAAETFVDEIHSEVRSPILEAAETRLDAAADQLNEIQVALNTGQAEAALAFSNAMELIGRLRQSASSEGYATQGALERLASALASELTQDSVNAFAQLTNAVETKLNRELRQDIEDRQQAFQEITDDFDNEVKNLAEHFVREDKRPIEETDKHVEGTVQPSLERALETLVRDELPQFRQTIAETESAVSEAANTADEVSRILPDLSRAKADLAVIRR